MSEPAVSPSRFRTLDLCYIAVFSVLIAVGAWISVPFTIPFTLQTFAIFAALCTLGGKRGTLSILVYLLLGAAGLPVFAGFKGGLGALLGTTGGYLLGFILEGLLFWFMTAKLGDRPAVRVASCILGLVLCYAFGTAWFLFVYAQTTGAVGLMTALGWCVFPFVIPDLVKIALALFLSRKLRPFLH